MRADAVYEGGVLKLLEPLDLEENEHVVVSVTRGKESSGKPYVDVAFTERLRKEMENEPRAPSIEEVRRITSKTEGKWSDAVNADCGKY